jgi:hypothetical protein
MKWVYTYVAEAQARQGDIKGALQTAASARDAEDDMPVRVAGSVSARDVAYGKIAYVQALKGDINGARKTAALMSDSSARERILRRIEVVSLLSKTRSSGRLEERAGVLIGLDPIIETLNSPAFPWFTDLPGYLKSLNAVTDPKEIEKGVDRALMGELAIGQYDARRGGMLNTFEKVKDLGKTGD